MKFDVNILRYIEKDAWRVLVSVEMGMKNHELVPVELVNAISGLKHGGAYKYVRELLKHKLVHHENQKYDGYRLTPLGYDFLAIKAFVNRGAISGVGRRIGVGKESDVYEVITPEGETLEVHASSARKRRIVHFAAAELGGLVHETVGKNSKAVVHVRRAAAAAPAAAGRDEMPAPADDLVGDELRCRAVT